jgi:hypothetical protein
MKQAQGFRVARITSPGAILDNTAVTTNVVDTIGFSYAVVLVQLGATDIAMTALKVQHSDVRANATTLTSPVDIAGADFTGNFPSATADDGFHAIYIDLKGLGRYIDLVATVGDGVAGTFFAAYALLFDASITPSTAADRGLLAQLIV